MLQQLRRGAGSWVARLLLGLLVISFGLWGIGDVFRNFGGHTLASIGRTDISIENFRRAYDLERQTLVRRAGRPITNEQAEALGLRQRVISQLLAEAAFNEEARRLGLNVSKNAVVRDIAQDPSFASTAGRFDQEKFERLLNVNGYTEARYVQERTDLAKRRMLAQSLSYGASLPDVYTQAVHRLKNEKRTVDYIVLAADKFAKIDAPILDELEKYYEIVKASYNTPERRALKLLTLKPEDFTKTIAVSDDDARASYDSQSEKFIKPEKRQIEQFNFTDMQRAKETAAQLKANPGATDQLLPKGTARNDLGLVTKNDLIDPAVRDAAFALPAGKVSDAIEGQFGPVVVHVVKIEPGETASFEKAKVAIRQEIAAQRARDALFDVHDKIENERASGARLEEIATKFNLKIETAQPVDKQGMTEAQTPGTVEAAVLNDAFQSEQGIDNEPVQLPNQSWVWFEVEKIIAERERPLAEVRKQVEQQWRGNQERMVLSEKSRALLEELKNGKKLDAIAREQQAPLKSTPSFARDGKVPDFSPSAVNSAFRIAVNQADTGLAANNRDRLIFVVRKNEVPPLLQPDEKIVKMLRDGMHDDLLFQFVAGVQQDLNATVNTALAERLTAGSSQ